MTDQAADLREIVSRNPSIHAFLSPSKGVGLFSIVMNLAVACVIMKKRVLVIDSSTSMLKKLTRGRGLKGGKKYKTCIDLLNRGSRIQEVLAKTPYGVRIISGTAELLHERIRDRGNEALKHVKEEFRKLGEADIILLNLVPGANADNLQFLTGADTVTFVSTPDIETVRSSYGSIKFISKNIREDICPDIQMIINKSKSDELSGQIVERLQDGFEKFIGRSFTYNGAVPADFTVPAAYALGKPFVVHNPGGPASRSVVDIASSYIEYSNKKKLGKSESIFTGLQKFIDILR